MEIYNSRFFTKDDPTTDRVLLKIPHEWWSSPYEYYWASQFAGYNDICLVTACGTIQPFKFFLASRCSEVHGCDICSFDKNIIIEDMKHHFDIEDINLATSYFDYLKLNYYNLTALGYESNKFDKVYCISYLQHLNEVDIKAALKEIYRVLKPRGTVIITVEHPSVNIENLLQWISDTGFRFNGEIDTSRPTNAIYSPEFNCLNCFRILVDK